MLQGDGWRGFQLFIFESGERRSVRGVVLSNSCDVDPENPRDVPARVIFAPLVKLSAYEALLAKSGIDAAKVQAKITSIRAQKTTNVFFLPASGTLAEDHVVRLDEAHSMPVAAHIGSADREKLFTLSNTGFYMLVLKLSVHFCRLQERVNRKPTGEAADAVLILLVDQGQSDCTMADDNLCLAHQRHLNRYTPVSCGRCS